MFLDSVRQLAAGWIVKKLLGIRDKFPIRKARFTVAVGVLVVLLLPLLLITSLFYMPFLIWDIFDISGRDLPNMVHLVFILVYTAEFVFAGFQIKEFFDLLELIYHPVRALEEGLIGRLLELLKPFLVKLNIATGIIFLSALVLVIHSITTAGFSLFHLVLLVTLILLSLMVVGMSVLVHISLRTLLRFLIEKVWKKMDKRFGLSDLIMKHYKKEEDVIDIEVS
ncbi:MAG: hypothetical protein U9R75_10045 [Candidatus Thermoplasmatota archaeon]|nr:hypothetical protein [Candidatus Thermoplasmatota archaeon]